MQYLRISADSHRCADLGLAGDWLLGRADQAALG
jgi:hypothetical protein